MVIAALASLAVIAIIRNNADSGNTDGSVEAHSVEASTQNKPNSASVVTSDCRTDWRRCVSNAQLVNSYKSWSMVQVQCESSAKDSARFGTPKFPWFSFGSFLPGGDYPRTGIVTAIEPDAQFSNGFGAMVHTRVICQYDLNRDIVTYVNFDQK